jgi:hypothetical protein
MHFTEGFYQAPLTLSTSVYTAFIVFCGIYQFTRLPFGLKGAPYSCSNVYSGRTPPEAGFEPGARALKAIVR